MHRRVAPKSLVKFANKNDLNGVPLFVVMIVGASYRSIHLSIRERATASFEIFLISIVFGHRVYLSSTGNRYVCSREGGRGPTESI